METVEWLNKRLPAFQAAVQLQLAEGTQDATTVSASLSIRRTRRSSVVNRSPAGGRRRQSTTPSHTAAAGCLGPVPPAPPRPLPVSPAASRRLCPGPGRGARRAPGGGWRRPERPLDAAMPNALGRLVSPGARFPPQRALEGET